MKYHIEVGDKIYVEIDGQISLKTINYVSVQIFEWKYGWAFIDDIKLNPNKKSKVKYIINN
jgi:hypothetical protein